MRLGYVEWVATMATHSANSGSQQTNQQRDNIQTWRIRWFCAVIIMICYLVSIIAGIIGFAVTKNPYSLIFLSPAALTPLIYYLVPMDEKRFKLKMEKMKSRTTKQISKKRTP